GLVRGSDSLTTFGEGPALFQAPIPSQLPPEADPSRRKSFPVVDPKFWGTDGPVLTIARSGNTLYIGGGFSAVGPCTGDGVSLDRKSGAPRRPFALVNGRVSAVVSDGSGGWFIGGHFNSVAGAPRSNLAHLLSDGRVSRWAPAVTGVG